ncbi:DNA translocase FtsK [bacterium]|nr:DNA translocase FtsK [bacterium]
MAKKKKRKSTKKESSNYSVELIGILLIIIAVIGIIPNTGVVGNFISNFSAFLVGTWYNVLLVAVMIVGFYMIVKRETPDFITSKLIGLYIISISILILSHLNYIDSGKLKGMDIITETVNNFMVSASSRTNLGGGFIGSVFSALFLYLFDLKGTNIVTWALFASGIIMFTGVSIYDMMKKATNKIKPHEKHLKTSDKEEIVRKEEKYEKETNPSKDNKVVYGSIEELIRKDTPTPVKEESEEVEEIPADYTGYRLPDIKLLKEPPKKKNMESTETINHNVETLHQVFRDFGIEGKVVAINPGPTVTQYEMEIKSGTRLNKVSAIHSEIALALAAKDVRIQTPIPGKSTIGIEIPNKVTTSVTVREILESFPKGAKDSKLMVVLGRDIMGKPVWMEINKTPHLLVAGTTGSGKSVCINSIIVSILMRTKPNEVKLVLVDPKKVEFAMYEDIPHLLVPVVTNPKRANEILKKVVVEMEERYERFKDTGTKNIAGYNAYVEKRNEESSNKLAKMPFMVVIIDELADLMLVAAKEVEDSIMRITQMARAAGIHLIVATQRPSTDVITGVVKANIPSRISFAVSSNIDSRTILDMVGAEKLIGKGDMLYKPQGENVPIRIQGTFIDDDEIKKVVDYVKSEQPVVYDKKMSMTEEEVGATTMVDTPNSNDALEEPLYNEIVEFVVEQGKASSSLIQRRFRLGYNRAARVMDLLEERGIVGPPTGSSKPREVLVGVKNKEEK